MGCARLRGDGHHWADRGAGCIAPGGRQQGSLAHQPDAIGPDARPQFLRAYRDANPVGLSDCKDQRDPIPDPNAVADPVPLGQSIGDGNRRRFPDAMPIAVCYRDVIGFAERQRETFRLALTAA